MVDRILSSVDLTKPKYDGVEPDEYSEAMTPDIVRYYQDNGLETQFLPILARHVGDLHVGIGRGKNNTSRLTVKSKALESGQQQWYRFANINEEQLDRHAKRLNLALTTVGEVFVEPPMLGRLALDWLFFELSADAAGNSVYMQHVYDKYIPDLDGQSNRLVADHSITGYAEHIICGEFFEQYAASDRVTLDKYKVKNESPINDVVLDHENLKAGIALEQLKDQLLRLDVINSLKKAEWVTTMLKGNYPYTNGANRVRGELYPLEPQDVQLRLSNVYPRDDVRQRTQDLASIFDDR